MEWPTGQERRAWLDRKGQAALDAIQYYLGPGVNVGGIATIADMFNPVADIQRAGTAARGAVQPGLTASERAGYVGSALTDMASVLAPVAGAAYADDAARGLTEGLANMTMPADDAAARFVVDEDGAIRAWHGSPHDFDRFSMDKIGTGEGAQAYGHGLYFAENKRVAKGYRDTLSGNRMMSRTLQVDGNDWFDAPDLDRNALKEIYPFIEKYDSVELALDELKDRAANSPLTYIRLRSADLADYLEKNIDRIDYNAGGRLYEVNIDANPEDFLDWDAPLSAQVGRPRQALDDFLTWFQGEEGAREIYDSGTELSGLTKYSDDLTSEQVTTALKARGIPGIRYLDAGSRGAGDGSRNYVVFDDRLVDILGKDGQRTTPQGKAQDVLDLLTSGRASEVTDDMLDLGDPVLNAQLNEYLYRNYDLPMDEASRMARARGMGLTSPALHGSDADIQAFDMFRPNGQTGVYTTGDPTIADVYARRRYDLDEGGAPNYVPVLQDPKKTEKMARGGDYRVTYDPASVRSRFARFDPRLAHLRNLSAGLGGIASLPILEEQMRAYLDSLPES